MVQVVLGATGFVKGKWSRSLMVEEIVRGKDRRRASKCWRMIYRTLQRSFQTDIMMPALF